MGASIKRGRATSKRLLGRAGIVWLLMIPVAVASPWVTAEENSTDGSSVEETTGSFLKDRGATGAVVGSILAGSAIAHPLAPILGNVVGFFVGKSTDYSDDESGTSKRSGRQQYAARSLIPPSGAPVASLGVATAPASTQLAAAPVSGHAERTAPFVPPISRVETASRKPRQLAAMCAQVSRSLPLPVFCYHFAE